MILTLWNITKEYSRGEQGHQGHRDGKRGLRMQDRVQTTNPLINARSCFHSTPSLTVDLVTRRDLASVKNYIACNVMSSFIAVQISSYTVC